MAADSAESDIAPPGIGTDPELEEAIGKRQVVRRAVPARLLIPLACGDEVRYVVELNGAAGGAGSLADALIALVGSYYEQVADAETDPLTRLANRRVLYSQVGRALARRAASSHRRFLAVIDIDHFKLVNDRFGHLYGDEILIHFARLMRSTFRAGDLLYRFGGEEFVVLYSVERHEDRQLALERFRAAVEAYPFPRVGRVTASIGFTALEGPIVPATTFVDRADNAVYYAKRQGRNRVCEYEALVASGALEVPQAEPGGEATLF